MKSRNEFIASRTWQTSGLYGSLAFGLKFFSTGTNPPDSDGTLGGSQKPANWP